MSEENQTENTIEDQDKVKTEDGMIAINGLTSKISDLELELGQIKEELITAKDAADDAKDKMLRAVAEVQNVRRRADIDVTKAHQFGLEKFVRELIPVIDSLEKAVQSIEDASQKEGVEMTLAMMLNAMGKFAVEQINPKDEVFNPELHEAVSMIPVPNIDPNRVIEVINKGYALNSRVLRPAMVVVSANQ